jgi:hypothetical protein
VPACPHPGLQVEGRCYFCLKVAATNGHRSKLSLEQLTFVGFVSGQQVGIETSPTSVAPTAGSTWLQPTTPSTVDAQIEELERLRDIAPGWYALARRILEDNGDKS